MKKIKMVSLFSGIGAPKLALKRLRNENVNGNNKLNILECDPYLLKGGV